MTRAERRKTIHPPGLAFCPGLRERKVCGRKLRGGPRDKRRSLRLKS